MPPSPRPLRGRVLACLVASMERSELPLRCPKCALEYLRYLGGSSKAGREVVDTARAGLEGGRVGNLSPFQIASNPISASSFERRNIPRRLNGGASIDGGIFRCRQGEKGVPYVEDIRDRSPRELEVMEALRDANRYTVQRRTVRLYKDSCTVYFRSRLVCAGHAWSSGTLSHAPPPCPKIAAKKSARPHLFLL